jgi:hypothetical protein|tara:strand:+ start:48 stop:263 length:216 start_codon:yes stop_codon:yes gene_type:complete
MIGKMIPKLINKPEVIKLLKKTINTNTKSKKKVNTKTKKTRYTSSPKSGIVTSGGLLLSNLKISNKKLFGS